MTRSPNCNRILVKIKMFSSIASAVNSAASTLAPDLPPVVDFRHHWSEFLKYYSSTGKQSYDNERARRPIEMTHQVHHLNSMLKLLAKEQKEGNEVKENTKGYESSNGSKPTTHGLPPCMEYLVDHQVSSLFGSKSITF